MRTCLRWITVFAIALGGWAATPPLAQAANLDNIADHVFGQANFTDNSANTGGVSAQSLAVPLGMVFDAQGNLYVSDANNNRVLEFDDPLTSDHVADRVFGQPDFTHNAANNGGISAHSLHGPDGVALDAVGNLYVADFFNNRVLEFDAPLTSDRNADLVIGQPDFTHNAQNNGGLNASSLAAPLGVALDADGNLYVTDYLDSRALEYDHPLTTDQTADHVFGQPDFTHDIPNNGGISASSLYRPKGIVVDLSGTMFIADTNNSRVLEYHDPLNTNSIADYVFGQGGSFTSNTSNLGGVSADSLIDPQELTLDARGDLYVADGNNRVLEYDTPLISDDTADRVFGQPNFGTSAANNGGISASRLNLPEGLALDPLGNLYVSDALNNRVLAYDQPIARQAPDLTAISPTRVAAGSHAFELTVTGHLFYGNSVVRLNGANRPTTYLNSGRLVASLPAADVDSGGPFAVTVFTPGPGGGTTTLINLSLYTRAAGDATADMEQGQPGFVANDGNNLHLLGANRLSSPNAAAVDRLTGRLFVADGGNNRVLSWPNAAALVNGQAADLVLGQPNFESTIANAGGRSARSLNSPFGVAVNTHGDVYVADRDNHRVLEYDTPLSSGMAASRVFGQGGSFTTGVANNGGVSANSLYQPWGLALDGQGHLYVADALNNRVLEYDSPLATDRTADRVFGQANFGSNFGNPGGRDANTVFGPIGVALDPVGNLYVADALNNRVLEYDDPLTADHIADRVFGQPNFTSGALNNGGLNANSLYDPAAVVLDSLGNLYVADYLNNRLLEYDAPLTNRTADRVFGQPGFFSGISNAGGPSASSLFGPAGLALDARGNLYAADISNNRVLEYDQPVPRLDTFLPLAVR